MQWNKTELIGLIKERRKAVLEQDRLAREQAAQRLEAAKATWLATKGPKIDAYVLELKRLRGPKKDKIVTEDDWRRALEILNARVRYRTGFDVREPDQYSEERLVGHLDRLLRLLDSVQDETVSSSALDRLGFNPKEIFR